MKRGLVIGLVIAVVLIIATGIYFYAPSWNSQKIIPENTTISCTDATCRDTYQNCYYACVENSCNQIQTLVALSPYPNCSTITSTNTPVAQSYDIELKNFAFNPMTLNIKAGDTIIWTNKDPAKHTVTSDSGTELDSPLFGQGDAYAHTFKFVGTYNYHCGIHTSMKGTVIVS